MEIPCRISAEIDSFAAAQIVIESKIQVFNTIDPKRRTAIRSTI